MSTLKIIAFIFIGSIANAEVASTFRNLHYDSSTSSIENFILGRTCYSLRASELSLNCNPALLANETKHVISLGVNIDSRAREAANYQKDLENNNPFAVTDRLLETSKPFLIAESATAWWQHEWFAFSLVPARLQVISVVTNPAYPVVTAHALYQREVDAQAGLFVGPDPRFRVGLNLRYVENYEFRDQFAFLDVVSGAKKLAIEQSKLVYAEPAVTYRWDSSWSPEVSLVLTQLQVYNSGDIDQRRLKPELGYATSPDFLEDRLRTSIHFTARPDVRRFAEHFRFGGIYEFTSNLSASVTLAGDEYGLGAMAKLGPLGLGAGIKTELISNEQTEPVRVTTGLFQLSLSI